MEANQTYLSENILQLVGVAFSSSSSICKCFSICDTTLFSFPFRIVIVNLVKSLPRSLVIVVVFVLFFFFVGLLRFAFGSVAYDHKLPSKP